MGAGVAQDEPAQRVRHRLEEGGRDPLRRHHAEPVAVEAGVLGGDRPLLARDPHDGRAPLRDELAEVGLAAAGRGLGRRQVAEPAQQVVGLVEGGRAAGPLQLLLDLVDRPGVEQLAQVVVAQELGEQGAVELQRLRPPLGRGRVALVHVRGDVVEEERRGKRRGLGRLDLDHAHLPAPDRLEQALQGRHLEHVGEHLAVGLEQHRERPELDRDLLQVVRLQALLPERRSLPRAAAREQEGAGGVLAEAGGEERALRDALEQQVVQLVGGDRDQVDRRRRVGVGQPQRDAVVGPHRLDLDPQGARHARLEGERPGRVDAAAERREHADAPVADLVAEPLDDDGAVGRDDAGRRLLVVQVGVQVAGGALVEVAEAAGAGGLADGPAELVRAADAVALPERHPPRHAGRGRDEHAVAGDLLDPPRRRPELEHLALAHLVHHLLVELAHPGARLGQEHAVEAAVGDRPAVRDGQAAGVGAGADDVRRAIPDDARAQLGELVRRVPARQHVEHALELGPGQVAVGVRPGDERVQVGDVPVVDRRRGHELLGEHVERLAGHARVLDLAAAHALDHDGGLEQVAAVLGDEAAERRRIHLVAGPADPLQAGRDRLGRLDLHDEVDRAHVDAELERRGGDQRRQTARLEHVLDLEPLLARDRAVVGAGDVGLGELVQAMGDPLGRAAAVHEDERRAVLADELEQTRVERRPDRLARLAVDLGLAAQLAHVLDRDDHLQVERLARAGVDDLDLAVAPAEEAGDLLERPLRRREPDPLHGVAGEVLEPLERERQVGAALGRGDGVDLVDDHRLRRGQHLPGRRRQDQVERLRRRDQDVRRVPPHRGALVLGRVAAAHRDRDRARQVDAGERCAQVLLDVVVERLERRDVDDARAARLRVADEAVDRAQERGQRLARAGRGEHERVAAGGDRRPALPLGGRGLRERAPEPVGDGGGEGGERVGGHG